MTCSAWLENSVYKLKRNNISTARLDSLVLLEDIIDKNRAWLLAHPEYEIPEEKLEILNMQIVRRSKHEPLAYIRNKSEFYGLNFKVTENTLEPRPETETLIDSIVKLNIEKNCFVDIGTGTGAIAITLKKIYPDIRVIATDIDNKCIQVAKHNSKTNKLNIEFYQGNLLSPLFKLLKNINGWTLVANLPYVPKNYAINKSATFEPKHAIFGGEDGLKLYKELFSQIQILENKPNYILTESLPFQQETLYLFAKTLNYELLKREDFIQVFKLIK